MTTKLQEARQRVRDAEEARIALAAKFAAEDAAQEPAKVALERHLKRNAAPVVVLTAGSYKIFAAGVASLSGYGWSGEVRTATEGYKGKAREERAIALFVNGALTYNLGGASLKCKGLAVKSRVVTGTHLKEWQRAHEKVRKADAAASLARSEEVATIRAAFDAGTKMTVDEIAAVSGRKALLESAVRPSDQWQRDRKVKEAREVCEAADAHLAALLAKSKEPCECATCVGDRKEAEYAARADVKRKETEKAAAAAAKVKARAPWREFTCPMCGKASVAQVLPKQNWDGTVGQPVLRCATDRCHQQFAASAIKSKPAKRPEVAAA
jgi:hypothetical protein